MKKPQIVTITIPKGCNGATATIHKVRPENTMLCISWQNRRDLLFRLESPTSVSVSAPDHNGGMGRVLVVEYTENKVRILFDFLRKVFYKPRCRAVTEFEIPHGVKRRGFQMRAAQT